MNCEELRSVVHDLARDEQLDRDSKKRALEHVEGCAACDELLGEAEALTSDLQGIAALHESEQAPARVEKALTRMVALRRTTARTHLNRLTVKRVMAFASIAAAAVFAVLLMARGGSVFRLSGAAGNTDTNTGAIDSSLLALGSQNDVLASFGDSQAADQVGGPIGNRPDEVSLNDSFVPLSDTFDATSLNDGNIVRVVISRSALDNLGLHLGQGDDAQVVADLVVTSDGVPQAIHVVSW
jgi:hypothetical protein